MHHNTGGTVQEVELAIYDSDSLSSPPSSSEGSEVDPNDDILLDFTRDDEYVIRPGTDLSGTSMAQSVRQAQDALKVCCLNFVNL